MKNNNKFFQIITSLIVVTVMIVPISFWLKNYYRVDILDLASYSRISFDFSFLSGSFFFGWITYVFVKYLVLVEKEILIEKNFEFFKNPMHELKKEFMHNSIAGRESTVAVQAKPIIPESQRIIPEAKDTSQIVSPVQKRQPVPEKRQEPKKVQKVKMNSFLNKKPAESGKNNSNRGDISSQLDNITNGAVATAEGGGKPAIKNAGNFVNKNIENKNTVVKNDKKYFNCESLLKDCKYKLFPTTKAGDYEPDFIAIDNNKILIGLILEDKGNVIINEQSNENSDDKRPYWFFNSSREVSPMFKLNNMIESFNANIKEVLPDYEIEIEPFIVLNKTYIENYDQVKQEIENSNVNFCGLNAEGTKGFALMQNVLPTNREKISDEFNDFITTLLSYFKKKFNK